MSQQATRFDCCLSNIPSILRNLDVKILASAATDRCQRSCSGGLSDMSVSVVQYRDTAKRRLLAVSTYSTGICILARQRPCFLVVQFTGYGRRPCCFNPISRPIPIAQLQPNRSGFLNIDIRITFTTFEPEEILKTKLILPITERLVSDTSGARSMAIQKGERTF